MKRLKFFSICFFIAVICSTFMTNNISVCAEEKPMLAIVIDDFGQARGGVEKMLSANCPLTCAVMPGLDFSVQDAENAHKNGHEVILHMPMEAYVKLPDSWYGPKVIRNYDTPEKARAMIKECLAEIPHAVGVNIHIGSGVCLNKSLMKAILEEVREEGKYFLDSRTNEKSVCGEVALTTNTAFAERDFFLEVHGNANYDYAKKLLLKAAERAKIQGHAIAIGHVGAEGGLSTAQAIIDSIKEIEEMGVQIVPLSEVIKKLNSNYIV